MHSPGTLSAWTVYSSMGHFFWCYQQILFHLHLPFLLTLQKLMPRGSLLSFPIPRALWDSQGVSMAEPELAQVLHMYTHIPMLDNWITWKLSQVILLQPQHLKGIYVRVKPDFSSSQPFFAGYREQLAGGCCPNKSLLLLRVSSGGSCCCCVWLA